LNLGSCEYWSAVLTSRPPGQPADITFRTVLQLFFFCAIGSSCAVVTIYNTWSHWLSGLYPLSGILNTKKHNVSKEESSCISVFPLLETLCFLVFRILDNGQGPETQ
jgi:hypothetical protein